MVPIEDSAISPNQRSKQQQIIDAAQVVLARDGLASCTTRAVAEASPLTKSAVHYYFRDIHEIVDRAIAAHLDAMLHGLRRVAEQHSDPRERLYAVLEGYLATFTDKPHAAFLWFEYWIAVSRRGATAPMEQMLDSIRTLLRNLLAALDHTDPECTAHTLLSWLLGTVVQQNIAPTTAKTRRAELDQLLEGPAPLN